MRLSCSYNFFNGEEHLLPSLKSIRNTVDYITIVYQSISNRGEHISEGAMECIQYALSNKLADEVYLYTPDLHIHPHINETKKREIGLNLAIQKKCTHFFSIDADEFYFEKDMKYAKDFIEKNNIIRSFCHSYMHIKSPRYRCLDTTNVCFIHKINKYSKIGNYPCPVSSVDGTRIIKTYRYSLYDIIKKPYHVFPTSEIAMYHMNFVRADNLANKLRNTSTENREFINTIKTNIDQWTPGKIFIFPGKGEFEFQEVENSFNTYDSFNV